MEEFLEQVALVHILKGDRISIKTEKPQLTIVHKIVDIFLYCCFFSVPGLIGCLQAIEVVKIAAKMTSILLILYFEKCYLFLQY